MYKMLGLYEDALVQYDELDALFTQFVLNHAAGGELCVLVFVGSLIDDVRVFIPETSAGFLCLCLWFLFLICPCVHPCSCTKSQ